LHPADSLDVQTQILEHVLDVPDPANVIVREQTVSRGGAVGDDEAFLLVFPDRRYGQADFVCQHADGDYRIVRVVIILIPTVCHKALLGKSLQQ
jgi:hypothetical protein